MIAGMGFGGLALLAIEAICALILGLLLLSASVLITAEVRKKTTGQPLSAKIQWLRVAFLIVTWALNMFVIYEFATGLLDMNAENRELQREYQAKPLKINAGVDLNN